jgi:hypothetical protein
MQKTVRERINVESWKTLMRRRHKSVQERGEKKENVKEKNADFRTLGGGYIA